RFTLPVTSQLIISPFFFFTTTSTTEIYTLSLHDALPIYSVFQVAAHEDTVPLAELYRACEVARQLLVDEHAVSRVIARPFTGMRSEEHTSELQSRSDLVCRLLLEKKNYTLLKERRASIQS